jgi:hypothetical protein
MGPRLTASVLFSTTTSLRDAVDGLEATGTRRRVTRATVRDAVAATTRKSHPHRPHVDLLPPPVHASRDIATGFARALQSLAPAAHAPRDSGNGLQLVVTTSGDAANR